MQKTQTPQADKLAAMLGKENTQVNTPIFTLEDIPNTPFKILIKDQEHTLVFGKYRLTDPLNSIEEVLSYLEEQKWNITATLALIIMDKLQEGANQPKDTNK